MSATFPTGDQDRLLRCFADAGYQFVEPAVLQPADIFLDLAGEELRRRLFLTAARDGVELCLRPDFTIPVCRRHVQTGQADRIASYAYFGPVFRQRAGKGGEFPQAGIESIGRTDRIKADAETLALARDSLAVLGQADTRIRIGDIGLFTAVLDALNLTAAWRRRLRDALDDDVRMDQWLKRMAGTDSGDRVTYPGIAAALENDDPETAGRLVQDFMAIAGLSVVGGRTAAEIAERFVEQTELSISRPEIRQAAAFLRRYLAVSGAPRQAAADIARMASDSGLDIATALDRFAERIDGLEAGGFDPDKLEFRTDFGRRLGYYTGFVFEIYGSRPGASQPLVGGGRYDGLLTLLGAPSEVPAVGFSMWIDRLAGGGQ